MVTGTLDLFWTEGISVKEIWNIWKKNGYSFLIMVKGMKDFIREIVINKTRAALRIAEESILIVMNCTEQLSGACYTKVIRKKEISIFTTVMEKHMEKKQEIKQKIRRLKKYLGRMCWERMCSIWTGIIKYFYLNFEKDGRR